MNYSIPDSLLQQSHSLGLPSLEFRGFQCHFRSSETPSAPASIVRVAVTEFTAAADAFQADVACPGGGLVRLELKDSLEGDTLTWTLHARHEGAGWVLEEIEGPEFFVEKQEDMALLLPDGLGTRIKNPHHTKAVDLNYPAGNCTMAWSAMAGPRGGWYLGRHDREISSLWWRAEGAGDGTRWWLSQKPWLRPSTAWRSAPIVLRAYAGEWHEAARTYRRWADSWFSRASIPAWVQEQTGWFLAILKQQNGAIYWNYHDLHRVWKLALDHGLSSVGLFGWAHGGHDRYYPDYHPDPAMGGEAVLRKALAEARKLGLRTVLYANGQLIDSSTEFYRWHGNDACSWRPNHEPYAMSIRKFNSSTPVTFVLCCHGAPLWQAQMRKLALAAEDLGADGILYDQIGVSGGTSCHHPGHNHATPDTGRAEERVAYYSKLAEEMRAINPEFTIMTEGIFDALTPHMGWFHGWGTGFAPKPIYEFIGDGENDFPGLFRTVFPEVPLIQRFGTPALDAAQANHALLHGLSHEIEARWPADLRYLEHGEKPADDAFADCTYYPPDLKLMQRTTAAESRSYISGLCEFATKHADLLRHGTYLGDEGIAGQGSLSATSRLSGTCAGVIVVNSGDQPVEIQPTFRGLTAVSAHEPGSESIALSTPISPDGVRLYRYQLTT
jgi:hypothetical protein